MNENIKGLIRAVADNDVQKAKAYAKVVIENDKAQTNKAFCQSVMNKHNKNDLLESCKKENTHAQIITDTTRAIQNLLRQGWILTLFLSRLYKSKKVCSL